MKTEPIYETSNLALWQTKSGLEIHLQGNVHSLLVGSPVSVEAGKRFMDRAERYPDRMKSFVNP